MVFEIFLDGRVLGKLRKLLRRLGTKSLALKVAWIESRHYAFRQMQKRGYQPLADLRVVFKKDGLSIWVTAFHTWVDL